MSGLIHGLLLPALRFAVLILAGTAVISLLHLMLSPQGLGALLSFVTVSQVPGAVLAWGLPLARVGVLVGLVAAFIALGLSAVRVPERWRVLLVGVLAGGVTGYVLFSWEASVHVSPLLEYLAVALYAVAGAQLVQR